METLDTNVGSIKLTLEYVGRFLKKLAMIKRNNAPQVDLALVEIWHEALDGYTLQELGVAYKEIVRTTKFFPDVSEIIALIDRSRYGTADTKFIELTKIIKEYQRGPHDHRTCDEIMGRAIELLGGLELISLWKPEDYSLRKPEFARVYRLSLEQYAAGEFEGRAMPIVGGRLAVPVGSDPLLLLAPSKPVRSEESGYEARKAELKKPSKFDLKSLGLGQKQVGNKEKGDLDKEPPQKLKFIDRLYQIAIDQGWWEGDTPQITTLDDRLLNDVEVKALEHCSANNKNLMGYYLCGSKRGWFKRPGWGPTSYKFSEHKDPMLDKIDFEFMTQEDLAKSVSSRLSPDQAEIYNRKQAEGKSSYSGSGYN